MPATFSIQTGDGGVLVTQVQASIQLPDSYSAAMAVAGVVKAPGQPAQALSGTPSVPAVPGSGSTFWQLVANVLTGALSVLTSATADPPAADAGPKGLPLLAAGDLPASAVGGRAATPADQTASVVLLRQTIASTATGAPWQNATTQLPGQF